MMKELLLTILLAAPVLAETKAQTLYFSKAILQAYPSGNFRESVLVLIKSDSPGVRAFVIAISFTRSDGKPDTKTQVVERYNSETNNAVATFYVEGITDLKPALVTPLVDSGETADSR